MAQSITVQNVIDTIMNAVPGAHHEPTVDKLKTGNPAQIVSGIVTAFTASVEVIRKTVALGSNLIITHEPTFYDHWDKAEGLAGNPVFEAKRRLIAENQLAIWRFHDHWDFHPEGILTSLMRKLGWEKYQNHEKPQLFDIPPTPLTELIDILKAKLCLPALRGISPSQMTCRRVALLQGAAGIQEQFDSLGRDGADVLVCGEVFEWQICEYMRDSLALGQIKALLLVGHERSEAPGMEHLAEWLRPKFPGIPITYLAIGDPITIYR